MNCIIVVAEDMVRRSLARLCEKVKDLKVVTTCAKASQVIKYLTDDQVDLLIVDLKAPDLQELHSANFLPQIVFLTDDNNNYEDTFDFEVTDYLSKPASLNRLKQTISRSRIRQRFLKPDKPQKEIYLKVEGILRRINYNDILYIEKVDGYLRFQTYRDSFEIASTFKELKNRLNDDRFLKINRSYMVNLEKASNIMETSLDIEGLTISFSRANQPVVMHRVKSL